MGSVTSYETSAGRRWRARYRTPGHAQTDKRGFTTKRDAEQFLATVEVDKMRGAWVSPSRSRVSVNDWAEVWLDAQVQVKPTTLSGYRHALQKHVLPRWGRTRLADVAHADVQTWVSRLALTLGPSAVRQTHLVLAGVLKYAVRDGRLARNPCEDIRLPRLQKHARGYLTHQQVSDLATEVGVDGDLVLFLAYTGLRWGEMAALRVQRLDMLRRRLEVTEAVAEVRGQLVWGTPKGHERRSVPFPSLLSETLARRCERKGRDDLVFATREGGVMRGSAFRTRYFRPAVLALRERSEEFPLVTPHDLRHSAASLAVSAGANVKAVQRMLGHASAAMTLDVYADLFDDDLDAVASVLDRQARAAVVGNSWAEIANQPASALSAIPVSMS